MSSTTNTLTIAESDLTVSIQDLRNAIPAHCFKPSYRLSLWYLFRDLVMVAAAVTAAIIYIPQIETHLIRYAAWAIYGYAMGLVGTGLWILGHECGHQSFSSSVVLNHTVGFILHSALGTPYFSWVSSHARHHMYANNLDKDHTYVPLQRSEYASSLMFSVGKLEELTEDSPVVTFLRIALQQLFGLPYYFLTHATGAPGSLKKPRSSKFLGNSHFLPSSSVFRPEEAQLILASDLGLLLAGLALWYASTKLGVQTVMLLWLQPYVWVNHWIVAITYLHHTHPEVPKFEPDSWTFVKGATATIDHEFGWVGKHLFHGIIEFHVVHHLFSRIPFYHCEEATNAIIPLLGNSYHADKERSFFVCLWEAFTKCQWIEPDAVVNPKDRAMWFKNVSVLQTEGKKEL